MSFVNVNTFVVKFLSGLTSIDAIDDDVVEQINKLWSLQKEDLVKVLSKKVRVKKDKNHPKKNLTSYFLYQNDQRAIMKKKHPDAAIIDISRMVAAEWKRIKESSKKSDKEIIDKYTKLAAEDKVRYTKEMETYVAPDPTEEEVKTKRSTSAYVMYVKEEKIRLESKTSLKGKKLMAKIRENWKSVKENEDEVKKLKEKAIEWDIQKAENPDVKLPAKRGRRSKKDKDGIKTPKKRSRKTKVQETNDSDEEEEDEEEDIDIDENIDDIKQVIKEELTKGSTLGRLKSRLKKSDINMSDSRLRSLVTDVKTEMEAETEEQEEEADDED